MKRKRYRCRSCQAIHHAFFGGQCRACKKPGTLRKIVTGSISEAIASAVTEQSQAADVRPRQQSLFEES